MDDLRAAIEASFRKFKLSPVYADQRLIDGHILLDKIFPDIENTLFGLYEISNQTKPNVFIELGYAKGAGKRCILLVRQGVEPPSDLAGFDRIVYTSYKNLTERLKRFAPQLLNDVGVATEQSSEPVSVDVDYYQRKLERTTLHYYIEIDAYHAENGPMEATSELESRLRSYQEEAVGKFAAWLLKHPRKPAFEISKNDLAITFDGGEVAGKVKQLASSNWGEVEAALMGTATFQPSAQLSVEEVKDALDRGIDAIEYEFGAPFDLERLRSIATENNHDLQRVLSNSVQYRFSGEALLVVNAQGKGQICYGDKKARYGTLKSYPTSEAILRFILGLEESTENAAESA